MDSSDVTPSRLFSSGEAHGLPQNGDSALIERRYRTSFGGYVIARWCFVIPSSFVIRDSSFIAVGGRKLGYAVTPTHCSECRTVFRLPRHSRSSDRDSTRSNRPWVNERNRAVRRRRRHARA